jgi:hypothetical protein
MAQSEKVTFAFHADAYQDHDDSIERDIASALMEEAALRPPLPTGWVYEWRGSLEPDLDFPEIQWFRITGKPVRVAERTILEK